MAHRDSHPELVEGCFGCKVQDIGVQTLQIKHGANPVEHVPVIADDGVRAGKKVGMHKKHWDGRQDATVLAPNISLKTKAEIS